jgi:hypothetical protein
VTGGASALGESHVFADVFRSLVRAVVVEGC